MMFVPRLPDTGKTPILDILWFSVELEMCLELGICIGRWMVGLEIMLETTMVLAIARG